jgi:hypothetical protein
LQIKELTERSRETNVLLATRPAARTGEDNAADL